MQQLRDEKMTTPNDHKPDKDEKMEKLSQREKYLQMKQDIGMWSRMLIILGVVLLFFGENKSVALPIIIVLTGFIASFIIEPAMYIVIGSLIIMLSIINSVYNTTNTEFWLIGLLIIMSFLIFRLFNKYKDYYDNEIERSNKFIVFSFAMFGLSSLFLILTTFVINNPDATYFSWFLALYGVSSGFASLFSENVKKIFPLTATVLNIGLFITFYVLATSGKIIIPTG